MGSHDTGIAAALATALYDDIAAAGDEIEAARRLPDALVDRLNAGGAFRLLIPTAFGGRGADLPDFLDALQTFAEADASTAWCVSQGAVIGTTSLWLEPEVLTDFWAAPETAVANGPPRGAKARRVEGGHVLNGDWGFSSGCNHATWMHGAVRREDDGAWLGAFFPKVGVEFIDNWHTGGLRGTGSLEFRVRELVVPDTLMVDFRRRPAMDDEITRLPVGLVFAVSFASVALGVARGALDAAVAIARGKVPAYSSTEVVDDPDMQKLLGEAEGTWRAGRAFLRDTVDSVWDAIASQEYASEQQRVDLRIAGTHTIRMAADVLERAYTIAGSTAIYSANPLQRRFQDMHTITQHVQARLGHYGYVGRYLFGKGFEGGPLN